MKKSTYTKIKQLLEEHDLTLNNTEIDLVLSIAKRAEIDSEHIGVRPERCSFNDREAAFQKHWLKENQINPGINSGQGTLQNLFINLQNPLSPTSKTQAIEEMTTRDRKIVATVIQWLGSNIGFCFLQETLKDCGYIIIEEKKEGKTGQKQGLKDPASEYRIELEE